MKARQRLRELDGTRAIAAAAVVLIHAAAAATHASPALELTNRVLRAGVPAFFLLSGALVWGANDSKLGCGMRRFAKIAVPYVAWSVLYLWLRHVRWGGAPLPFDASMPRMLFRALVSGDSWYHLYFVPVLLVLYLLTPVARLLARLSDWAPFAASLGVSLLLGGAFDRPRGLDPAVASLLSDVVRYAPFMAAGLLYARRRSAFLLLAEAAWPALLGAGIIATSLQSTVQLAPLGARALYLVAALALVGALLGLAHVVSERFHPPLEMLSRVSFVVYLAHPAVLALLHRELLQYAPFGVWDDPGMIAIKFAVGLLGALACALVLERGRAVFQSA